MSAARVGSAALGVALGIATAGALSSCATQGPAVAPAPGHWSGRFSLTLSLPPSDQNAQQGREERAQGRFTLTRSEAGRIDLDLFSPFGQTLAQARSEPGQASLVTHDGQRLTAVDPDTLIERALGWRLPVSALPDWLQSRAEPAPNGGWVVRFERRFADGRPRTLQADWPADARLDERRLRLRVVIDGEAG
ncbi:MAG: outer membrane lipoprotein LolB [Burkholderiaceae bacterium]